MKIIILTIGMFLFSFSSSALENNESNCKEINNNSKDGMIANWDRRGQECRCEKKNDKGNFIVADCGLATADPDFMAKELGTKSKQVDCYNTINSVNLEKDKEGHEIFKVDFDQNGGGSYDYKNKGVAFDDDGAIVIKSLVNEAFSKNPDIVSSEDYKKNNSSPTSKMSSIAIADPNRIKLLTKALDMNIKAYTDILKSSQDSNLKTNFNSFLKLAINLRDKLKKKNAKGVTFQDLKELEVARETIAAKVEISYEVDVDHCGTAQTYSFGVHYDRSRCNPPLNPLGLPFAPIDYASGTFKDPIQLDKRFTCTNYITDFKAFSNNSSQSSENSSKSR